MLYIGNSNKDYYLKYGATESQLFFTPYAVDNEIYRFTNQEKEEISERLIKEINIDEAKLSEKLLNAENVKQDSANLDALDILPPNLEDEEEGEEGSPV